MESFPSETQRKEIFPKSWLADQRNVTKEGEYAIRKKSEGGLLKKNETEVRREEETNT